MKQGIKIHSALGIAENVCIFKTEDGKYIFGYSDEYIGPHDPRYKTFGALYTGEVITETTEAVADVIFFGLHNITIENVAEGPENDAWYIDRFGFSNIMEAAKLVGAMQMVSNNK